MSTGGDFEHLSNARKSHAELVTLFTRCQNQEIVLLCRTRRLSIMAHTYSLFFQLKYKRRVYKMLHLDEKQLKSMNTKASRKKFLEAVANGNVEKVTKMCSKGIDPNFHCLDSGGKNLLNPDTPSCGCTQN